MMMRMALLPTVKNGRFAVLTGIKDTALNISREASQLMSGSMGCQHGPGWRDRWSRHKVLLPTFSAGTESGYQRDTTRERTDSSC